MAQGLGVRDAFGLFRTEAFRQIRLESPHFSGQHPKQLEHWMERGDRSGYCSEAAAGLGNLPYRLVG